MATEREVEVEWIGGLMDGEGKIISTTSGRFPSSRSPGTPRNDETEAKTSPEELLAAAHASCFAMQLAHGLVGAGWDPEVITVRAKVSFELGIGITDIDAHRAGRVGRAPATRFCATSPSARRRRARLEGARRRRDHARAARPAAAEDEEEAAEVAVDELATRSTRVLIGAGAAAAGIGGRRSRYA